MKTSTIVSVLAVIIIVGGGWYWYTTNTAQAPSTTTTVNTNPDGTDYTPSVVAPATATVTYTTDGFSPSSVTIKKGDIVTWVDRAGSPMWVASAQHPVHDGYDGTSRTEHCAADYSGVPPFDQCKGDTVYSFTFDKVGTWKYHDHLNASRFGSVVVTE